MKKTTNKKVNNPVIKQNLDDLIDDAIRAASAVPISPASERVNLDIIKSLMFRLTINQVILEKRSQKETLILFILSLVMAIESFFAILSYFK
jgi:hypothetical protein